MLQAEAKLKAAARRYWQLCLEADETRSADDWQEEIQAKLQETVRLHLLADVPVGAFLSGGLDSSAVRWPRQADSCGSSLQTFSIGFHEEAFSELPHARRVAGKQFATDHVEDIRTPDAARLVDETTYFLR